MPFLQQSQTADVVIPAGQSIRVGALRGAKAQVLIPSGLPGGPTGLVADGQSVFGPYPTGTTVQVLSQVGETEYVVGASPVLTDQQYNPASVAVTGGSINNATVGATTRNTGAFTTLAITGTDSSGTPGNVTNNSGSGRAAIAAAATTIVVTNSTVAAADHVFIQPRVIGTPAKWSVVTAAGSFTVTVDVATGAAWPFDFVVIKN